MSNNNNNNNNNNNINTLRSELFDTLAKLKNKEITVEEAKAVCEVSQSIINTAKVEVDYLRISGSTYHKNTFIDVPAEESKTTGELPNSSVFRLGGSRNE